MNKEPIKVQDSAYLRPQNDALFDSEYYDPSESVNQLDFFVRPQSSCFKFDRRDLYKTLCDTNITQSCMLEYPHEFSLTGFGLFIDYGTSKEDMSELINNGVFEFHFSGLRPLFSQPLNTFPNFIERTRDDVSMSSSIENEKYNTTCIHPFRVKADKYYFKIKPGEAFRVLLKWNSPPKTSKSVKLTAIIDGIYWTLI